MAEVITAFVDDLARYGINVSPADIVADSAMHRVHVDGDRRGSENLVYKIHNDERPSWWFCDHKRGIESTGTLRTERPAPSEAERKAWAEQRRKREQAVADQQDARAEYCQDLFNRAKPVGDSHPYLERKGLKPTAGIRRGSVRSATFFDNPELTGVLQDALLIPIRSAAGIRSMQAILPDGDKFYARGGAKQGGFHAIHGADTSTVLLCEGYATGNALNAATGYSVACAMDSGNLMSAAEYLAALTDGRRVIVCGDNDHRTEGNPGVRAATAVGDRFGWRVECPEFDVGADGTDWDDWLRDAGSAERLRYILEHGHGEPVAPEPEADEPVAPSVSGELVTSDVIKLWEQLRLTLNGHGIPDTNLDNVCRILNGHAEIAGRIWYDEFLQRVMTSWPSGEAAEWSDGHDGLLTLWVQRSLGIKKATTMTVAQAVTVTAMANSRNEVTAWLNGLSWDYVPRLDALMHKGFGVARDPYSEAVGRCWLISMVARAFTPGCKVDTMPVFEGGQGMRKSTAMEALVGKRWFAEASESPTSKDFYQALHGKLLVEIAELDSFSRAEVNTIKRVITCKVDRYRSPYGRRAEDHPRMCVFSGTTNRDDWNRDETGARRFWPIACVDLDIDWITANRSQLFAEAVAQFRAGRSWWDVPVEDAKREQERRRAADEWEEAIREWLVGRSDCTVAEVMEFGLKIEVSKWDKQTQMRVATCLRAIGWERTTAWRGGRALKMWVEKA